MSVVPIGEEETKPPEYQISRFLNEFDKGENKNYDNLIKTIKSKKTDDAIGITFNKQNNECVLGTEKCILITIIKLELENM